MGIKFKFQDNKGLIFSECYARIVRVKINSVCSIHVKIKLYSSKNKRDESSALFFSEPEFTLPYALQKVSYDSIIKDVYVNAYKYLMGLEFFKDAEEL